MAASRPLAPVFILRGHASDIASLAYGWQNRLLFSGDASGFVIAWSVAHWRAVAVWKAHDRALIALSLLTPLLLLTHGRDGKLKLWDLCDLALSADMSTVTPVAADKAPDIERKSPSLVKEWLVNTLNFCGFAHCSTAEAKAEDPRAWQGYIAVPNGIDPEAVSLIEYSSSSEAPAIVVNSSEIPTTLTIKPPSAAKKGMVMAVALFSPHHQAARDNKTCNLAAAYENGTIALFHGPSFASLSFTSELSVHAQPPLSIAFNALTSSLHTSGADALLSSIPVTSSGTLDSPTTRDTKHAGQDSLALRCDDQLLVTAGWDGRGRVYSSQGLRELAVLKWHTGGGLRAAAWGHVFGSRDHLINEIHRLDGDIVKGGGKVRNTAVKDMLGTSPRQLDAYMAHLVALGGKDGKISLWKVY